MAEHPPRAGTNGSARRPLPPVVEAFASRGCARLEVDAAPRQVRIRQRGEMWLKPGGRSLSFSASQWLAVERVAFSWRACFPIAGPLALSIVDEYDRGGGGLAIHFLGLPVRRARGPETVVGEALRYLAELPFNPPAVTRNPELEWRALDGGRVEVATAVGSERLAVSLELDAGGNVARASSAMRKLERDGRWQPTPWGGEFSGYAELGDLHLPTRAEAFWELEDGRYTYWRAELVEATVVA
jgi:hypothetical protein